MATIRLTAAEAAIRYLAAQHTEIDGRTVPLFGGVWAIFGHGNVAGLGPALEAARKELPTLRAHNEQAMAHAAIAYAKTHARRRMMACTTSIGPGATNMVTAAAVAHVNRLPVLFLPGDVFANRRPDPVLQQVEDFGDGTVSANDCFRPVSRYWDRITRPEQLLNALPAALRVLTDPVECGPVTLAFPQDVQPESYDYPAGFFERRVHRLRRPEPDVGELRDAIKALKGASKPLILAGGGVKYSLAEEALAGFAGKRGIPVCETQAGKGSLAWDQAMNVGSIGVTGSTAANALAAEADVVLVVGSRLCDFASGSRTVFPGAQLIGLNVGGFDAAKHGAQPLVADARAGIEALGSGLGSWKAAASWTARVKDLTRKWNATVDKVTTPPARDRNVLPTDAQVLGAVNRNAGEDSIVVCAAGGLPGELHKLWRAPDATGYHLEYGYSCMGYEIAGGLGVKLARPEREVVVLVGDGSYLMMNSEIATSVALRAKLVVVVLDNGGFGCIERLQAASGGAPFNNRLSTAHPRVDFAAHAASLGAAAEKVASLTALADALARARSVERTSVIVIETDPAASTSLGGAWWDVPVADDAPRRRRRAAYRTARTRQRLGG